MLGFWKKSRKNNNIRESKIVPRDLIVGVGPGVGFGLLPLGKKRDGDRAAAAALLWGIGRFAPQP